MLSVCNMAEVTRGFVSGNLFLFNQKDTLDRKDITVCILFTRYSGTNDTVQKLLSNCHQPRKSGKLLIMYIYIFEREH